MRKRGFKTHKTHKNLFKNSFRPSFVPSALPRRHLSMSLYRNNAPLALAKRLVRLDVSNSVKSPLKKPNPLLARVYNSDVVRSAVCAKRKIRRAVLFATGKGGGNHRPPRYTLESQIRC